MAASKRRDSETLNATPRLVSQTALATVPVTVESMLTRLGETLIPYGSGTVLTRSGPAASRHVVLMRARDLRGMTEDRWVADRPPATENLPVCSAFAALLLADLPSGISAGGRREAGGRLRQDRQQKIGICREFSTGATGLEPATSGVTGRYGLNRYSGLRPGIIP